LCAEVHFVWFINFPAGQQIKAKAFLDWRFAHPGRIREDTNRMNFWSASATTRRINPPSKLHGRNQVDQKTKANARANPYMIILCVGTTTSAPPDVVLELVLVVGNGSAFSFKHPIDVVIVLFVPFLATMP